jgi:membrane protein
VIGAVFAMISGLFCTMVVIVGSAVAGHEVSAELGRIRRGERPADDEIQREWDNVIGELRSRWEVAREEFNRRRKRSKEPEAVGAIRADEPEVESIGSTADGVRTGRDLAPPP